MRWIREQYRRGPEAMTVQPLAVRLFHKPRQPWPKIQVQVWHPMAGDPIDEMRVVASMKLTEDSFWEAASLPAGLVREAATMVRELCRELGIQR